MGKQLKKKKDNRAIHRKAHSNSGKCTECNNDESQKSYTLTVSSLHIRCTVRSCRIDFS